MTFNAGYYYSIMQEHSKFFADVCKEPAMFAPITDNPFWDIVRGLEGESWFGEGWQPKNFVVDRDGKCLWQREPLVRGYAWAIPDPVTLQ